MPRQWMTNCIIGAILMLTALTAHAQSDSAIDIPFELGGPPTKSVYGKPAGYASPIFFVERLPSFFERHLILEQLTLPDGELRWVFTGPRGGFTIALNAERLRLEQRFYDSSGFNEFVEGHVAEDGPRYAEKLLHAAEVRITSPVRELRVILDHRFRLAVAVNGTEVASQTCVLDVSRQQLHLTSTKCTVRGTMITPPPRPVTVVIDPAEAHQVMRGWGGIVTPPPYNELSAQGKRRWWELLAEYNLLVHREYPVGGLLNREMENWDDFEFLFSHHYGDIFPNSEMSDFAYLRNIRKLGGTVWFEFWGPPAWAWETETNEAGQAIPQLQPELYAEAVVGYCKASVEQVGVPPDVVGVQNEPSVSQEDLRRMTKAIRKALDEAGFVDVPIHMPNGCRIGPKPGPNGDRGGLTIAKGLREDPEAWDCLDFAACNLYDFQSSFTDPDSFDAALREWRELIGALPFLAVEICVNSRKWQLDSYRLAFQMGQLYHKTLTLSDAAAIAYCWLLLTPEQPSFGWSRSLFVLDTEHGFVPKPSSKQLRVYGSYSRRIAQGMTRVGAQSPETDLLATAFRAEAGELTVVLMNRSLRSFNVTIEGAGKGFLWQELTDQYHENAVVEKHGSARIIIKPGAIVTLSDVPLGTLPSGFNPE